MVRKPTDFDRLKKPNKSDHQGNIKGIEALIGKQNQRQLMLRRHVWVNSAWLTSERLHQQQRLARRPRARFASAAFVSGDLDCATDPHWWRRQTPTLQCPFHVVVASEAPPRSRRSMQQLAQDADQVTFIPGRLGLHQEFGALLARTLLAGSVGVHQGRIAPAPE